MLRWSRSLAVRAVAALLAVHLLTIMVGLGLGVVEGRKTRFASASLALEFAREELRFVDGRWMLPEAGHFADLAKRNPRLWFMAADGEAALSVGEAPVAARRLLNPSAVDDLAGGSNLDAILRDAAIERRVIDGRPVLITAGGVDPATVTSLDVLRSFTLAPAIAVFLGLGGLGAIALFVAVPMVSHAIRPTVDAAASMQPDDEDRRLDEARAPPELLPLARAFNGALDRLALELARRRRLISNVAHELRTPLAVLSLRVDTVSLEPSERESLRIAVDRLRRMTEQMLDLERLSVATRSPEPIELGDLARQVCVDLAPVASEAGSVLSLKEPAGAVIVRADRDAIIRALTNLIGNAVQHGGPGAVQVTVGPGVVEVSDQGPGVPDALAPRLFEPFARGSSATAGSGLGLHLTREIMRSLGGDVDWRRESRRTVFRLKFPTSG